MRNSVTSRNPCGVVAAFSDERARSQTDHLPLFSSERESVRRSSARTLNTDGLSFGPSTMRTSMFERRLNTIPVCARHPKATVLSPVRTRIGSISSRFRDVQRKYARWLFSDVRTPLRPGEYIIRSARDPCTGGRWTCQINMPFHPISSNRLQAQYIGQQ